ncbi:hypothetical protein BGZ99_006173, partial [Dissophora globulifera]
KNSDNTSKNLDNCTCWIDRAGDMAWLMVRGSFDEDELQKADENGTAEEFVKSNYTFSVPFSQMSNKEKWVHRNATVITE